MRACCCQPVVGRRCEPAGEWFSPIAFYSRVRIAAFFKEIERQSSKDAKLCYAGKLRSIPMACVETRTGGRVFVRENINILALLLKGRQLYSIPVAFVLGRSSLSLREPPKSPEQSVLAQHGCHNGTYSIFVKSSVVFLSSSSLLCLHVVFRFHFVRFVVMLLAGTVPSSIRNRLDLRSSTALRVN